MVTECYTQVRGSALRVTGLDACGDLIDSIPYAVSKSAVKVSVEEITESGGDNMIRDEFGRRRLRMIRPDQTIRYVASIEFTRVDPGLLNLIAGVPLVESEHPWKAMGFGEGPFGVGPFGGGYYIPSGGGPAETVVAGFDMTTRLRPVSFAMEVWTRLSGPGCAGKWGYTVFPFLKGGRLAGFSFARDGMVSFNLVGAATQRGSRWGSGPFEVDTAPLPAIDWTTGWRNTIVEVAPPSQTDGIQNLLASV